jgi:hypothetical protein
MFGSSQLQIVAAASVIIGIITAPVGAQQATRTDAGGFFIGGAVHLAGLRTDKYISDTSARVAIGAGSQIRVGWANKVITPFVGIDLAYVPRSIGSYKFANLDFGARLRIPPLKRLTGSGTPYVEAAISNPNIFQNQVKVEGRDYTPRSGVPYELPFPSVSAEGIVKTFGAGLSYRKNRHHDLEIGFDVSNGSFDSVRFGGQPVPGWDFRATTVRLHLGINWHPHRS